MPKECKNAAVPLVGRGTGQRTAPVYLMVCDTHIAADLTATLTAAGFRVQRFDDPVDCETTCRQAPPFACIMDLAYVENDPRRGKNASGLLDACPPVIFVSPDGDISARLSAARTGAVRFFHTPVDGDKLVHSLRMLARRAPNEVGRVLWISDREVADTPMVTALREADMAVEVMSRPEEILARLEEFRPDAVVVDVDGPDYGAVELAWLIRQNDSWTHLAVLLMSKTPPVSGEAGVLPEDVELLAAPPDPVGFVVRVGNAVKRARRVANLTHELRDTLRENQFQLATMDQHDIVSVTDVAGRITKVNDRFCEISGYSREELLGQNHRILKSGVHPPEFYQEMWDAISRGEVWRGTICNRKKSGEDYWVESTIVPFLDNRGRPYKYVSARTDVTELRKNELRLELGQLYANIGTWDWDIRTGNLYWSDRVAPLFGFMEEIHETDLDSFIALVHESDRESVLDAINISLGSNIELSCEFRVIWPDGTERWMLARGDVLRRDDGNPLHMLGIVQDIDTRKRAEHELIEARDQAESANRAKSQFLSSMSHELRTPLNAIMGFGQLLRMDTAQQLSETQCDNIEEILRAGKHLLTLINEVLDLARVETGNIELSLEPVPLNDVIIESLQLIMPLAASRGIKVSLIEEGKELSTTELTAGGYAVMADSTRLKQVIINLLSNAVKYNRDAGSITVSCLQPGSGRIRIEVSDLGQGLSSHQKEKLFVAFERLGAEETGIEGTGIGMVIARSLIELMGGSIGVESRLNEGSTFWIELPEGHRKVEDRAVKRNSESIIESEVHSVREQHTVLYIEDNPANLRLVDQLLQRRGDIRLMSACEPQEGLKLVALHQPDLVLLDINLPGMDGYDVLEELRKLEAGRSLPVVAISANAMPGDIERGKNAGFVDYITKPVDVHALLGAVDAGLSQAKAV